MLSYWVACGIKDEESRARCAIVYGTDVAAVFAIARLELRVSRSLSHELQASANTILCQVVCPRPQLEMFNVGGSCWLSGDGSNAASKVSEVTARVRESESERVSRCRKRSKKKSNAFEVVLVSPKLWRVIRRSSYESAWWGNPAD
jgi:hypothetical protein